MALGDIGSIASGVGSIAGAFGGSDDSVDIPDPKETTFQGPLFTPTFRLGGGVLTRSVGGQFEREASAQEAIQGITTEGLGSTFGTTRGDILADRAGLTAGFGRLSKSTRDILRDSEAAAAGNLRQQLSQRQVLGSSFANAQQSQLSAEFGREQAAAAAEAFQLEEQAFLSNISAELGLNEQELSTINTEIAVAAEEADLAGQIADRELTELNITASTAAEISQRVDDQEFRNATRDLSTTTIFTEEGEFQIEEQTRAEVAEDILPLDPDRPKTRGERKDAEKKGSSKKSDRKAERGQVEISGGEIVAEGRN